MHDIEPYFKWRNKYRSDDDQLSPFFRKQYSEFAYTNKIYNYYIHPQWDEFGSNTLYLKIIFVEYDEGYAFIELIGEWNDCLHNDIMFLKREIIDRMLRHGIYRFVLLCDNVLNFHSGEDAYYEEWYEEVIDEGGWICLLNTQSHVLSEMLAARLQYYLQLGHVYNDLEWHGKKPEFIIDAIENAIHSGQKSLNY